MSRLVWSPNAKADIQRHYNYLYPRNFQSATRAVNAIVSAGRSLTNAPEKGVLIDSASGLRIKDLIRCAIPEPSSLTLLPRGEGDQI